METIDISYSMMPVFYVLLIVPLAINYYFKTGIGSRILVAVLRMTVQLFLVALYLELIFTLNSLWINAGWILVMLIVANIHITNNSGLRLSKFYGPVFIGLCAGILPVVIFFVCAAVRPDPLYNARYLIPIAGMVLGNCLRANIISIERFFSSIRSREKEYICYLLMDASLSEAVRPYMRQALRAAFSPTLATMATLGLVALPGMMTGQILGGSSPAVAIKYQIAIMIAIFWATVVTAAITIRLCVRVAFTDYLMLDRSIFTG